MGTNPEEFDPDGDIILVLRRLSPVFAVWDETHGYPPDKAHPTPTDHELAHPSPAISTPLGEDSDDELVQPPEADDDELVLEDGSTEPITVEMRVSSRHLILASSYFRKMLKGNWKESNGLKSQQCFRIEVEDWDPDAMRIIMDIIHGRTRNVPKSIDLEMLAKIAVIVDYYEYFEVVEIFSDIWIKAFKRIVPTAYSRDTMLWVCISWVFHKPHLFETATGAALKYSEGPVQTMELPIPEKIIRRLIR
jgi:hypothetical protein